MSIVLLIEEMFSFLTLILLINFRERLVMISSSLCCSNDFVMISSSMCCSNDFKVMIHVGDVLADVAHKLINC